MRTAIFIAATALLVAGCSEDAPQQEQQTAKKAALTPGEYEASWTVAELGSIDKTPPATELAVGATGTARGCVADGGEIDPVLFALAGHECTASNSFVRGGRLSLQMECRSEEQPGQIMQSVTGQTTAESFEAEVSTTTYFVGSGDYAMKRTLTGRRVGECPPAVVDGNAVASAEGTAQ